MIFGDKNIYAIEVHHKPLDNGPFYMAGRLCIHLFNIEFGDINEEDCSLAEPYMRLNEIINNFDLIKYDFKLNNDYDIFHFFDHELYVGDDYGKWGFLDKEYYNKIKWKELEGKEINKKLYKYDFMTNEGEMFNNTKSFIYMDIKEIIHILFQVHDDMDEIRCNKINKNIFYNISSEFIEWYEETEKNKVIQVTTSHNQTA